jgi:hypothetical protein
MKLRVRLTNGEDVHGDELRPDESGQYRVLYRNDVGVVRILRPDEIAYVAPIPHSTPDSPHPVRGGE